MTVESYDQDECTEIKKYLIFGVWFQIEYIFIKNYRPKGGCVFLWKGKLMLLVVKNNFLKNNNFRGSGPKLPYLGKLGQIGPKSITLSVT